VDNKSNNLVSEKSSNINSKKEKKHKFLRRLIVVYGICFAVLLMGIGIIYGFLPLLPSSSISPYSVNHMKEDEVNMRYS